MYRLAIDYEQEQAAVYNEIALVQSIKGDEVSAIDSFRQSLKSEPDNSIVMVNLAQSLIRESKFREAKQQLEKAIQLDADNANAHFNLGLVHSSGQDREKEEQAYRQAIVCDPNHPQALFRLGRIMEGQGKLPAARELYSQALPYSNGSPAVLTGLGRVCLRLQELDDAEKYLTQAAQNGPNYADAFFHLGNLMMLRNNPGTARNMYQRTLQINRQHPGAAEALQRLNAGPSGTPQ